MQCFFHLTNKHTTWWTIHIEFFLQRSDIENGWCTQISMLFRTYLWNEKVSGQSKYCAQLNLGNIGYNDTIPSCDPLLFVNYSYYQHWQPSNYSIMFCWSKYVILQYSVIRLTWHHNTYILFFYSPLNSNTELFFLN